MVRKSKSESEYAPIRVRCQGSKDCERREYMRAARTGILLDISEDYYPEVRAWLIDEEQTLAFNGETIKAGYMRDNISEHDRRYGITED